MRPGQLIRGAARKCEAGPGAPALYGCTHPWWIYLFDQQRREMIGPIWALTDLPVGSHNNSPEREVHVKARVVCKATTHYCSSFTSCQILASLLQPFELWTALASSTPSRLPMDAWRLDPSSGEIANRSTYGETNHRPFRPLRRPRGRSPDLPVPSMAPSPRHTRSSSGLARSPRHEYAWTFQL